DGSPFRLWQWAKDYTLADRFFMGAFGGSYLNHQYLVCACAARHPDAPAGMRAVLDPDGRLTKKPGSPSARVGAVQVVSSGGGQVTPDGLSVNTSQPLFQPHHQPFNYHARFAPGTADRSQHLKDGDDLLRDIAAGTLPRVTFYKPAGRYTQHPSYTDVKSGDQHMADVLDKLRASPQWS